MNKIHNTYLNIITETWNRFLLKDIIKATGMVTNNFKDNWVSAKGPGIPTSKKVLEKLNESANIKYGSQVKQSSELFDKQYADNAEANGFTVDKNSNNYYDGNSEWDEKYIINYWQNRAKSGDAYSSSMYYELQQYAGIQAKRIIAAKVGKIAYGIWKALNARLNKIEKNQNEVVNSDFNLQQGQKVDNINLIVNSVSEKYNSFNTLEKLIICTEPKSGFKYKLNVTSDILTELFQTLQLIENAGYIQTFSTDPDLSKLYNISISGKLKNISIDYKSIRVSYVKLNSLSLTQIFQLKKLVKDKIKVSANKTSISDEQLDKIFTFFDEVDEALKESPELKNNTIFLNKVKTQLDKVTKDQVYDKLSTAERRQIGKIERELFD